MITERKVGRNQLDRKSKIVKELAEAKGTILILLFIAKDN